MTKICSTDVLKVIEMTLEIVLYMTLVNDTLALIVDWFNILGNLTSVQHHSASAENQLLRVTLTLAEDISRQLDVVEGRRADLIKSLLPAIARLAVAPASDSITRTICVKVRLTLFSR